MRSRPKSSDLLRIGDLARRTGLSVSAIRFYEDKRLIEPVRTGGNQRRFLRSDIRRLSFILIAQQLGLSLGEIDEVMRSLPHGRTPNARDWRAISAKIRDRIEKLLKPKVHVASAAEIERSVGGEFAIPGGPLSKVNRCFSAHHGVHVVHDISPGKDCGGREIA